MRIDTKMASGSSSLLRFLHLGRGNGGARRSLLGDDRGQSLVEFAFLAVVLFPLLLGIIKFGIALNNYLALTSATTLAAQAVGVSRGNTLDPCLVVAQAIDGQTPFTNPQVQQGVTVTLAITYIPTGTTTATSASGSPWSGTAANFSCPSTSNTSGSAADLVAGYNAAVTTSYPCNLVIYGINFAPNCKLTSETQEAIQ